MDLDDETQKFDDPQANELVVLTRERIREAGLMADPVSENPNIQYGASRFRKTTNELDRIYGIIAHAFNHRDGKLSDARLEKDFRTGHAVRPDICYQKKISYIFHSTHTHTVTADVGPFPLHGYTYR